MQKLNEWLGIEFPFIQGGMANIATGEFAAACSNAGALGMIATGGWDGDRLRQEIRRAKELLMEVNRMSEAEAHRFLQKRSMDTGAKLADTARLVLEHYTV